MPHNLYDWHDRIVHFVASPWNKELSMSPTTVREEARRLVDQLSDDATWEDLLYQIYVRQSVEAGLEDCRAGRLVPLEEVRKRLGLPT